MADKTCSNCNREIFGRADKKFCSDYCRSTFNNKENSLTNSYMLKVNKVLRKNRKILASLNPKGKTKIHIQKLQDKGFRFNYFTNQYITQKGVTYYFCYDQGFLALDNNYYALVTKQDYVD